MSTTSSPTRTIIALAVVSLVFIVYVWDRLAVPILLVEIREAYQFSLPSAGLLASVFTFGLAMTAVVAGAIVARFGMRVSLVASTLLFSVSTGYVAIGFGFVDLAVARVLGGVGEGIFIVALLSYLGSISERYRGAAMGLPGSLFGIGLFAAPVTLGAITAHVGWRGTFVILMLLGLAGAVAIAAITRGVDAYQTKAGSEPITAARVRRILTPQVIALAVLMAVNGIANYGLISVLMAFLREVRQLDPAAAGYIYSLSGIGAILGGVPVGLLADKIGRNVALPVLVLTAALSGTALFASPSSSPELMAALTLAFGVAANGIYVVCFALIKDCTPKSDGPLAIGLVATTYYLLGAFSGWILGAVSQAMSWGPAGYMVYLVPYLLALTLSWILSVRASRTAHGL